MEKQRLPSVKVEDVELMIAADALVPESYIALPEVRARVEQAICDAACGGTEHTARLSAQLEADYGPLPDEIRIKMQMENMRKLASELGVHQVQVQSAVPVARRSVHGSASLDQTLGSSSEALCRQNVLGWW